MKTKILLIVVSFTLVSNVLAAPQWWQQVYPSDSNSQITLKDENNNNVTAITNPTAASVKTSSTVNTRPPTIIVQATATLPVVERNTACISPKNTVGITADHTMLLMCQSNVWTANMAQGNITSDGIIRSAFWQSTFVVTENTSDGYCTAGDTSTWGRTARSATGATLSCQSGVWKSAQQESVWGGGYWTINGSCSLRYGVSSCSCPAGYTGRVTGFGADFGHVFTTCFRN